MKKDDLQRQADHCNDRKMASKRVQELSADLFFAVFVRVRRAALRVFCRAQSRTRLWGLSVPTLGAEGTCSWPETLGGSSMCSAFCEVDDQTFSAVSSRIVAPWSQRPW